MPLKKMPSSTEIPAILVIESNKFQRRSLCRLMRAAGANEVAEAADIQDAERVLAKDPAASWLVVADPDLIGANPLAILRALAHAYPVAGTLLLSHRRARALEELRNEAQQHCLDFIAVMRKPVSAEEIGTLLQQAPRIAAPVRVAAAGSPALSKEELSECLRTGNLRARFQPKVDIESGRPVGCEAAPYVTHARYGLLHADSFNRAMVQLGAQRVMTASVLRDAAKMVRSLREKGLDAKVAVHLGADMLSEAGDAASLDAYVRTLGVTPADFSFEIAASQHAFPPVHLDDNLARLKVRGYSLAIDVCACASALAESAYAHFAEIKLRLPNAAAEREPGTVAKELSGLLAMARKQGMATCAVGLQTEADLDDTRRVGLEFAQGDLFAPALPADEALAWVEREEHARSFANRTPKRHRAG